ncbi:MAG TPA: phosphoenolpyruvate carboxylase [Vicinamibacterales bacterium]
MIGRPDYSVPAAERSPHAPQGAVETKMTKGGDDPHKALRDDVRLLGELLGETLRRQEGQPLFERVERVRALAKRARNTSAAAPEARPIHAEFETLAAELRAMPVAAALPIARSFAHFLNLANVAEQHHRVRRRRAYQRDPRARPQPASLEETLPRLRSAGVSPDDLHRAVCALRIELVVTAHPTEIMRRSLQHKYRQIADGLAGLDHSDITCLEREGYIEAMRREITAAWETEEVRRERPSPLDEVRSAMAVFEENVWDALPQFCRSLDRTLRQSTGRGLPLDAAPIRFGSWIGGDRDGNPYVTPEVTRSACLMARWTALSLYAKEIEQLRFELSMSDATAELVDRVEGAHEPYRALLRAVQQRLEAARASVEALLRSTSGREAGYTGFTWDAELFESASEFVEPLLLCHRSLYATGNGIIADGRLTDVLRRLAAFGLTLVRLDVRQEAERHTEAIDAITRALGLGEYAHWNEPRRVEFLTTMLERDRRVTPQRLAANPRVTEVLDTFRVMAAIHDESLGAYVITMASRPSDVLAVELLQREAGVNPPRRVVPLFETSKDLAGAAPMIDALLSIPWYRGRVIESEGRIEVMVGYSDSAKDVGRIAAAWDLYKAQESIVTAARGHGVPITLFHGRGGSVGRGGGPTHLAIRSQPPGSVDGTLRVTEQGEMIQAKFGLPGIALRTLEVYTTATLEAMLGSPSPVEPQWRETMERVSASARDAFRATVYDDPRFMEYFQTATPVAELDALHIGSRPAKREKQAALQALRAIPWQFAWMQTRLLLPSWLGIEAMIDRDGAADPDRARDERDLERCREMYRTWPFFRSTVELIEMALAKADAGIAAHYDRHLVPADQQDLGRVLRAQLQRAIEVVLEITGHRQLLENNAVLRRSIDVRNPYVDPINLLQVELLRRLRASTSAHADDELWLRRALLVTINGIAAGMRNTG